MELNDITLSVRDAYARRIVKESLPTAADLPTPVPPPPPGSRLDMPGDEMETLLTEVLNNYRDSIKQIHGDKKSFPGDVEEYSAGWRKIGIIGAGCAGLYTAMILESLGLDFEIIEASNRIGGRLHTRKMGARPNDYYVRCYFFQLLYLLGYTSCTGCWGNAFP